MSTGRRWLRIGSIAAFATAGAALVAAVAGGITEPTGIAAVVAIVGAVLAYGVAPLVVAIALRLSALSSWWGVAAAAVATLLWAVLAMLVATAALANEAPALAAALIAAAPTSSALWILVATAELIRAGMQRWSLVVLAGFVSVLMIGSLFIELTGFDISKVLVPLGWAAWLLDLGGALRARLDPSVVPVRTAAAEPCTNCGAPRRTDGLAFCADCGLPYGVGKTGG